MKTAICTFCLLVLFPAGLLPAIAQASGRVEVELAVEERVAITARQEWLERLARAGVQGFRIRSAHPGDSPNIDRRGTAESPVYAVTGIITSENILVVPGARFRASEVSQFATWLRDLAEQGPPDERPAKGEFGLNAEDFKRLHTDLAPPLGFDTTGRSRADVIRQAARTMATRMVANPALAEPLAKDVIAEDLSKVSRGTALAYVLRSAGLCLVPSNDSGQVSLSIVEARPGLKIWPIGWKPEKHAKDIRPEMFRLRNVNVSGVSVLTALDAIAKRLDLPVLLDHNAVARFGLEPDKTIVQMTPSRLTFLSALRTILGQAGLKSELRLDEGDQPFLWVTSRKEL